jgi:hypothetical protein
LRDHNVDTGKSNASFKKLLEKPEFKHLQNEDTRAAESKSRSGRLFAWWRSRNAKRIEEAERRETTRLMRRLAEEASLVLTYLPSIREVVTASSAFRAGHAVRKFNYLNEKVFHFADILKHIDENILQLVSFLQFFEEKEQSFIEEDRAEQEKPYTKYLTIFATVIALLAALYTFPSFLAGFNDICKPSGNSVAIPFGECMRSWDIPKYGNWFFGILSLFGLLVSFMYVRIPVATKGASRRKWILIVPGFFGLLWAVWWSLFHN